MIVNWVLNSLVFITAHYKTLLTFWMLINLVFTFLVKSSLKKYYNPLKKKIMIDNQEKEVENIHDEYKEFSRQDKEISFFYLYSALCTYFWVRACVWIGLLVLTYIQCK